MSPANQCGEGVIDSDILSGAKMREGLGPATEGLNRNGRLFLMWLGDKSSGWRLTQGGADIDYLPSLFSNQFQSHLISAS